MPCKILQQQYHNTIRFGVYLTQLAKMIFDEIFDLTADVFLFIIYTGRGSDVLTDAGTA